MTAEPENVLAGTALPGLRRIASCGGMADLDKTYHVQMATVVAEEADAIANPRSERRRRRDGDPALQETFRVFYRTLRHNPIPLTFSRGPSPPAKSKAWPTPSLLSLLWRLVPQHALEQALQFRSRQVVQLGHQGFRALTGHHRSRAPLQNGGARFHAQRLRCLYRRSQRRQRGFFKQTAHRQLHFQQPTDARHHLQHQQRVPAQLKKVLIDPHLLQLQQFLPDRGQLAAPPRSAAPPARRSPPAAPPATAEPPCDSPSRSVAAATLPAGCNWPEPCAPAAERADTAATLPPTAPSRYPP